jgi:carboxypeptidase Taq
MSIPHSYSVQTANLGTGELYNQYKAAMNKIADLRFANAILQWDQETYLPPKGAALRGQQIATLSEMAHQLFSEEKLGTILNKLKDANDLSPEDKRNVELSLDDYNKNKKYSSAFVRQLSEQVNKTFHTWLEARKNNSFSYLEKDLEKLVKLKKEETEILGYANHPYDALLDEFEKGSTTIMLDKVFNELLPPLKVLFEEVRNMPASDDAFLYQHFEKDLQWKFGIQVLELMGYDFNSGRQDISEHPFTVSFNPSDVRVTTRIDENNFNNMTWSCIHEGGHALYEQGLPMEQYGLPLGEACSYSIHESQSRLWENCIGRSKSFCELIFPKLQKYFPLQFANISVEQFYVAINKVQASLIRTEADELTYHFHVIIRYELEKGLIEGTFFVKDIPEYWNMKYKEYLGLVVPDDRNGCIQDVHWSHGSFGYFPTYSLGSLYAVQLFNSMKTKLHGIDSEIKNGNFTKIQNWLKQNIYLYGRYFTSSDLCNKSTGKPLESKQLVDYLRNKYLGEYSSSKPKP